MPSIRNVISSLLARYKIEAGLGLLACFFFGYFVLPAIYCDDWDIETRTKLFTLFGIVGLMGLSVGFKRNELMVRERRDYALDKQTSKLTDNIKLIGHSELHIAFAALNQIVSMLNSESLSDGEINQIKKALAIFTISAMTPPVRHDNKGYSQIEKTRKRELSSRTEALRILFESCQKNSLETCFEILRLNLINDDVLNNNLPGHFGKLSINDETLQAAISNAYPKYKP